MKKFTKHHYIAILFMGLMISSFLTINPAINVSGKTTTPGTRPKYVVMPININVVNGTTVDKETIRQNIKQMNEIYNCEIIIFVWNEKINILPDPNGPSHPNQPDGNLNGTNEVDNWKKVMNESKKKAKNGVSITISNNIGDNINGICRVGDKKSPIVRKGTDGTTWAHELMHAFGHSHGSERAADEDINGAAPGNGTGWDANGDGKIDEKDKNYLLWGRSSDRNGTTMTETQHNSTFDDAAKVSGARTKNRPVTTKNNKNAPKAVVAVNDKESLPVEDGLKAKTLTILNNSVDGNISIQIVANGLPQPDSFFDIFFDIDSSGQGDPTNDSADIWIRIKNADDPQNGQQITQIWDNNSDEWILWHPTPINFDPPEPIEIPINYNNETGSGFAPDSFFDVFYDIDLGDDMHSMFTEDEFKFWFRSGIQTPESIDIRDESEAFMGTLMPDLFPTMWLSDETIFINGNTTIQGSGFEPMSSLTLKLDEIIVGIIESDPDGNFEYLLTADIDIFPDYNRVFTAMDEMGNIDGLYINILEEEIDDDNNGDDNGDNNDDLNDTGDERGINGFNSLFLIMISLMATAIILRRRKYNV